MSEIDIPTAMAVTAIGSVLGSHLWVTGREWWRRDGATVRARRRS